MMCFMINVKISTLCIILLKILYAYGKHLNKPNIVMIVADDMGSYDASFRGSDQFTTPNIDALAYNGIILDKHYTEPTCTPSRAALLTGQYPIRLGMQGSPISAGEDRQLPYNLQTLPQVLKDSGYNTHLVGKWHLGSAKRKDTPTQRGFDTHFGYWNGYTGYFDYMAKSAPLKNTSKCYTGFDLKDNFTNSWKDQGTYATDLYTRKTLEIIENQDKDTPMFLMVAHLAVHTGTDELVEVKDQKMMNQKLGYIKNIKRRRYADALLQLDDSVGQIMKKLEEQKILNNSIIVFISDNGAQVNGMFNNGGSNYPLRGEKFSIHEGGVRNVAILYSSLLKKKNYVYDKLFHITDWMPTFATIAGGNLSFIKNIDGVDHYRSLFENKQGKGAERDELLINIDEKMSASAFIGEGGRFKLVNGTYEDGSFDNYGPKPMIFNMEYNISAVLKSQVNMAIQKSNPNQKSLDKELILNIRNLSSHLKVNENCTNTEKRKNPKICVDFCLFDLLEDPCESNNLVSEKDKAEIFGKLKNSLQNMWNQMIPQTNTCVDIESDPKKYNGTWCTWLDDELCTKTNLSI